jgi:uncharacterized protein YndB with AHSA1/START domain
MDERTIEIVRVFDAPRERLWREWTEPERFADWFGGTESEVPLASVSMDVQPGGSWRLTMHAARGEIQWHGEYREVVEPERLVFTVTDEPGTSREIVIVELADLGDGRTAMTFHQAGFTTEEARENVHDGWSSAFDRLTEHLTDPDEEIRS